MNLWSKIKQMDFFKLLQFLGLLCQKPLLIIPIWKATKQTLQLSQQLYGKSHNGNGKANAFRHAYWNFSICKKTLKFTKNPQKSSIWTQKVVEYYEKVTKNADLDREMDLHNNTFGRNHFLTNFDENQAKTIVFFQNTAENAQKVTKVEEIKEITNHLVYIA